MAMQNFLASPALSASSRATRRKCGSVGVREWGSKTSSTLFSSTPPLPLSPSPPLFSPRRGISLLEVLFATFTLAVGLLSLAAMVPVGQHQNATANDLDRAAACARAAFRELETRDMLRHTNWMLPDGSPAAPLGMTTEVYTFVIDPLLLSRFDPDDDNQGGVAPSFPYLAPFAPNTWQGPTLYGLQVPRLTLAGFYSPLDLATSEAVCDRVFQLQDDLTFTGEDEDDVRPQMFQDVAPTNEGRYSWLAMVTPSYAESARSWAVPLDPYAPAPDNQQNAEGYKIPIQSRRQFQVAVVVFKNRVIDSTVIANAINTGEAPTERQVRVEMVGPRDCIVNPGQDAVEIGNLRPGQWVLISAFWKEPAPPVRDPPLQPLPTQLRRPHHQWYRITRVGQMPTTDQVLLKLSGPEWPGYPSTSNAVPIYNNSNDGPTVMTIADDVVGVYERTVELKSETLTSQ